MGAQIGTEVYFLDGCVVEDDYIYVATQLEDLNPRDYAHTRMVVYEGRRSKADHPWFYHDLECNIVSVCVKKATQSEGRRLCALSKEGEIEIYSNLTGTGSMEKIKDAGLRLMGYQGGGVTGYVTHIREIGGHLYVCGASGQVYRRQYGGWGWDHFDDGLFSPLTDPQVDMVNTFNCIDGNGERDLYVVGDDGVAFHHDGRQWRRLDTGTDEHLLWVRCYGPGEVYICGKNGVLLKGSARGGFTDVSALTDNHTWWCLSKFKDQVYLAASAGLYAWDGQSIKPVRSGLEPEIETYRLDCDDKALWSFGAKDLTFFNGQHWQRIHHPDNPRT